MQVFLMEHKNALCLLKLFFGVTWLCLKIFNLPAIFAILVEQITGLRNDDTGVASFVGKTVRLNKIKGM